MEDFGVNRALIPNSHVVLFWKIFHSDFSIKSNTRNTNYSII